MNNYYYTLSNNKYKLVMMMEDLRRAIKEEDKQHTNVLLDRLEKDIINLRI
jgi:ferritin-like protein